MVVRLKRCPHCGRNAPRDAFACSQCRTPFAFRASARLVDRASLPQPSQQVAPAPHDISCAILASMFVPGAGQMYNLQFAKGALLFGSVLLTIALAFWSTAILLVTVVVWVVAMIDAAFVAGRVNDHEHVTPYQWF